MTVRSVIDVEMRTGEWEKFQANFEKYQAQLAKTPSAWAKVSKENQAVSKNFERMAAALMAQNATSREISEANKKQEKHLSLSEKMWTSMAKSTKSVATSILSATRSLLSWSSILGGIGGLLGAGGLWGIDRIAHGVANQRQTAMGRGMSIGGQKAFATYFERLGNPDQFLDMVNQIETDPRNWSSYALGAPKTGDADKDSIRILKAMRARAQATPTSQLGLLDTQYGTSVGEEYWRRLKDTPAEEFNGLIQKYQSNKGAMGIPNASAWQNLSTTLGANWGKVGASFDTRLGQLAPNIGNLSDSFAKLAISLINSPMIEKGLKFVGGWLDKVSTLVSSPSFEKDVLGFIDKFGKGVSAFVDGIERVAAAIEKIASYLPGYDGGAGANATKSKYMSQLSALESNSSFSKGLLSYQFQRESGGSLNPADNKGHVGAFQFDPKTADWLNKKYHKHLDPRNPEQAAVLASYYDDYLSQKYGGNNAKVLAAWNYGEGRLDSLLKAHPKDWGKQLPQETKDYISNAPRDLNAQAPGLVIRIENSTGGSATVSASQLPH